MDVHAVLGKEGTGTTATAVNLAVALRRAGHHAAVLDLTGDVAALLGLADGGSDGDGGVDGAEPLAEGSTVAAATVDAPLGADVDEAALRDYREASGDGASGPAGGTDDGPDERGRPDPDGRSVDRLPVIVADERSVLAAAPPDRRESLRGDLAFAYDHVIVDAGEFDDSVAAFADGLLVVTTSGEEAVRAATEVVRACSRAGGLVVGAVVNRADEGTDASAIRDRMRTEVVGVIPGDARTPELEPVADTVPGGPAATAYGQLAGTVADWTGESGLVDDDPEPEPGSEPNSEAESAAEPGSAPASGPEPAREPELAADGDDSPQSGDPATSDDERKHPFDGDPDDDGDGDDDDGGGLLSRFF